MEDIRWQQRFEKLDKAHTIMKSCAKKDSFFRTGIEQTALIKVFEILFELSKTLKDYLRSEGLTPEAREKIHQTSLPDRACKRG